MSTSRPARNRRRPSWAVLAVLVAGLVLYAFAAPEDPAGGGPADVGPPPPAPDVLAVHFLDVGQGDATLLVAPDAAVLIDTGRHDVDDVVDHLRARGIDRLDLAAVTHPHADHLGQFDQVLRSVEVDEVWWSGTTHPTRTFQRAVEALERSAAAYEEPRTGDVTTIGSLEVEVLHPWELRGDPHGDSLVMRFAFGDVSFLFTGDAEADVEAAIVEHFGEGLASTIYQVGHHGSVTSTSSELLGAVQPDIAVYSAGAGNPYGHPHDEVVDRLEEAGVVLYGTDTHGTVTITTDGVGWEIHTERG